MMKSSPFKTIALFLSLIILVVFLSMISGRLWGGKPETYQNQREWAIDEEMTLEDFGQANGLPNPVLKEIFELQGQIRSSKETMRIRNNRTDQISCYKKLALAAEHETKNWLKILIKFCLWFAFLITVFILFRGRKVSSTIRKTALFISVLIFGVIMGSDPSPMGTVKDAIYLYGSAGAVFPPRMIALTIFLLIVFVANKYICAWGCHVGVLQDLIFRMNQTDKRKALLASKSRYHLSFLTVSVSFFWGFLQLSLSHGVSTLSNLRSF